MKINLHVQVRGKKWGKKTVFCNSKRNIFFLFWSGPIFWGVGEGGGQLALTEVCQVYINFILHFIFHFL